MLACVRVRMWVWVCACVCSVFMSAWLLLRYILRIRVARSNVRAQGYTSPKFCVKQGAA